jgi:hypothetical protein
MGTVDALWKLAAHSDRELLEGLRVRVGNGRQLTAEVLAHLGEVEERRLHLQAGYGSMFAYCVSRLGMSEDEACRRIDVARLARRSPALFPRLATGQISLSVAALLKPYLSTERVSTERTLTERVSAEAAVTERATGDADLLIAAVSGKSVQQAREALAGLFPRPDVAPGIRKLSDRARAVGSLSARVDSVAAARGTILQTAARQPGTGNPGPGGAGPSDATPESTAITDPAPGSIESIAPTAMDSRRNGVASARDGMASEPPGVVLQAASVDSPANTASPPICSTASPVHHVATTCREEAEETSAARRSRQPFVLEPPCAERLEPLSPGRYRVQFTADAALKEKLELARDLMRHTLPSGDLAAIVERSLDLLVADLMSRRFGAPSRRKNQPHTSRTRPPTSAEPLSAEQLMFTEQPSAEQPTSGEQPSADQPTSAERLAGAERATRAQQATPATQSALDLAFAPKAARTAYRPERFNAANATECPDSPPAVPTATRVDRATRRAVLERDGLRCAWRSADGVRCEARAWLEHDHIRPRAKGGSSTATNGRLLCRAHNRLAAEQEFGRQHVEQAIAKQRTRRRPIPSEQ